MARNRIKNSKPKKGMTASLPVTTEELTKALVNTANKKEIEQKQRGFLCMFSGGLDSTAMLHALLTNEAYKDFNVYVHHIRLKNRENRGPAELTAVRKIVNYYHKHADIREFDYKETEYDASALTSEWAKGFSYDMDVAAFISSQICVVKPQIKYVGIGVTKDDYDGADDMSLLRYQECPNIFNSFLYRFPPNIPKPTLIYPLRNMTKQQLWNSIPTHIRNMTWSCRTPIWKDGTPHRCGKCHTCLERKKYGIDS